MEVEPALSDEASLKGVEEAFRSMVGPAWARDLKLMYKLFDVSSFGMTKEEYDEQVELLGKEPSSYEKFVEDTARAWKNE